MAKARRNSDTMNFDTALQQLESIVKRLEEEEIPLEESLKLFSDGQILARACEAQLKGAENQIRQLLEDGGTIQEAPLELEATGLVEDDAIESETEDESAPPPKDDLPF